jgi:protein-tyrosine phosphatase
MIDIHCHILHGVDDGPDRIEESIIMLKEAAAQGITAICATPHVDSWADGRTEMLINDRMSQLRERIIKENIPVELILGSEIYFGVGIDSIRSYSFCTLGGTGKYWLVEFSSEIFPSIMENFVITSISWGIIPIIAHVERYSLLHLRPKYLKSIVDAGALLQVDAGCFVGQYGKRLQKRSYQLVTNGFCHIVASDAHGMDKKPIYMKGAYKVVTDLKGPKTAARLFRDNPLAILQGKEIPSRRGAQKEKTKKKSSVD